MNQNQNLDSSSSFNVRIQERQQWPSSSDSISRVDLDSIMNSQNQQKPSNITPSQERITEGEKVRKADMAKIEEKLTNTIDPN